MKTTTVWTGNGMEFDSTDSKGNTLRVDGNSITGSSPMIMLLHAIAGCSGADVTSIFEKQKIHPSKFEILVDAERTPEGVHPRPWKKIELEFRFWGEVPREKAERAVQLSMEKYCSVSAMLRHDAEITWKVSMMN